MTFSVLTIFPGLFDSYLNESLIKRALTKGLITVRRYDLRDFADPPHYKVDDRPFGGGPGMVMQVAPIERAVRKAEADGRKGRSVRTVLLSPRGKRFTAAVAKRLAAYDEVVLLCGRYEGVDERVAKHIADESVSIGSYVLSGGELAAMVVIEATSRFLPGFLGKHESLEDVQGSHPAYTRPARYVSPGSRRAWVVPKPLLSGNHKAIGEWRTVRHRKAPRRRSSG